MGRVWRSLLVGTVVAACASPASPPPRLPDSAPPVGPPAVARPPARAPAPVSCQRDEDCAVVSRTAGACPEAMLRAQADAIKAEQAAACAGGKGPQALCGPMPGCIVWMKHPQAGCNGGRCVVRFPPPAAPPPDACKRRRTVKHFRCSGVPHAPVDVGVCDGCVSDADCAARPGGRCALQGGGICESPPAHVCRYPGDVCEGCPFCTNNGNGAPVCKRQQTSPPP